MIDSFRGDYAFLSNFYTAEVLYKGITYMSSESAYQAQKTLDESVRHKISLLNASSAKRASRHIDLRSDWNNVKLTIMHDIVYAKFSQNVGLKEKLLATGNELLVEGNTWGDYSWGQVDGKGSNYLGKILMLVSAELSTAKRYKVSENGNLELLNGGD